MTHPTIRWFGAAVILALFSGASGRARAEFVTYTFTGIEAGQGPFSGSFTFNLASPGVYTSDIYYSTGIYETSAAFPMSFTVEQDGVTFSATASPRSFSKNYVLVRDSVPGTLVDSLQIFFEGPGDSQFSLNLADDDGTAFTSLALPTTLDLSQFESASVFAFGRDAQSLNFAGDLTSLAVAPSAVPEPASLALLGTGVLGLLGYTRRRALRA